MGQLHQQPTPVRVSRKMEAPFFFRGRLFGICPAAQTIFPPLPWWPMTGRVVQGSTWVHRLLWDAWEPGILAWECVKKGEPRNTGGFLLFLPPTPKTRGAREPKSKPASLPMACGSRCFPAQGSEGKPRFKLFTQNR